VVPSIDDRFETSLLSSAEMINLVSSTVVAIVTIIGATLRDTLTVVDLARHLVRVLARRAAVVATIMAAMTSSTRIRVGILARDHIAC
jgi:hypothetical protein